MLTIKGDLMKLWNAHAERYTTEYFTSFFVVSPSLSTSDILSHPATAKCSFMYAYADAKSGKIRGPTPPSTSSVFQAIQSPILPIHLASNPNVFGGGLTFVRNNVNFFCVGGKTPPSPNHVWQKHSQSEPCLVRSKSFE